MKHRVTITEPCEMLVKKLKEHNAIVMCPYCKNLFDTHTGLLFLEGKQTDPPPRNVHVYFEEVMK